MSDVELYLEHFGTKGMKWGVRKEHTTSDLDHKAQAKIVAKRVAIGAGVAVALGLVAYGGYEAKNALQLRSQFGDLDKFTKNLDPNLGHDRDKIIAKGSEFVRRSSKSEDNFMTRTYAVLGEEQATQWVYGNVRTKMEAVTDIRTPSINKQVDILNKTFGEQTRRDMLAKAAKGSIVSKMIIKRADDRKIASVTVSELVNTHWKTPKANQYIDALKREGYSGVADTNRLRDGVSTILFDQSTFKTTSVEQLANNPLLDFVNK